ncbi:MAG: glutamine amidotransferase [Hyphomonadaceae bacterium]|nr:glutamine amidotransferase [Hyphomonadaceae bacterium]
MRALAIRHVPFEDLGAFAPVLRRRGFDIRYAEAGEEALEDGDADLVLVLGGPIGVYDEARYPFIGPEIALIAARLARNAPTLGICLGAQLMAAATGARVYPAGVKEIGLMPITLTQAGRGSCLAPFADAPLTLHWHGDTFDLPAGATLLASTPLVAHQAFALGDRAIGFQFHPEAGGPGFERWLVGHAVELAQAGVDVGALRTAMQTHAAGLAAKAEQVLGLWLDQCGFGGAP